MSAPPITFSVPGTATLAIIPDVFSIELWANDEIWTAWSTWATTEDSGASSNQLRNGEGYSGYVLTFDCKITGLTGVSPVFEGSGCCLRDDSDQFGGGYCLVYSSVGPSAKTFWITDGQFKTALSDPWEIPASLEVIEGISNDVGFEIFDCTGGIVAETSMKCSKFQMRPAADFQGGFRFESNYYAKGYLYDAGATGKAKWTDEEIKLEGAVATLATASAAVAISLLTL